MKRFPEELRKAKLFLTRPQAQVNPVKVQVDLKSLDILGIAKILQSMGRTTHSKCARRLNVIDATDFVVANRAGIKLDEKAQPSGAACPFFTKQGCRLITEGLTVPGLCAKRIIKENPDLKKLDSRLTRAYKFLYQMVRLIGVRR
jgi:hypothetical protein